MTSTALIDWISFTLPKSYPSWDVTESKDSVHRIITHLFSLDTAQFKSVSDRAKWYRSRHTLLSESGRHLFSVSLAPVSVNNANTSAFSVPGFALSSATESLNIDSVDLVKKFDLLGGSLTRLDLALDYRGPVNVLQKMFNSSRPESWRDLIKSPLRFKAPLPVGWDNSTIYYGHLSKGTCICAYDKAREQGVSGPWTRIEFRTRDRDLCKALQADIVAGREVGEITAGMLMKYLTFLTPGPQSKYNRPVAAWWSQLLTEGADFKLVRHDAGKDESTPRKAQSLDAVLRYLQDAYMFDESGDIATAVIQYTKAALDTKRLRF